MFKKLFLFFLATAIILPVCGTLEITLDQTPTAALIWTATEQASVSPTAVQTGSDELTAVPAPGDMKSLTWKERNYDDYSFSYPLELYSVRQGSAILKEVTVTRLGVIELSPNDGYNMLLGQPASAETYRIKIPVQNNNTGWMMDAPAGFMSGAGALLKYSPDLLDANHPVQEYSIGGVMAFRVENLPTGQAGAQTHIMTLYNNKIYEWLIEAVQYTGDMRNMAYVKRSC